MLRQRLRLVPVLVAGVAMVASATAPLPALADLATGATSITVFLRAPDPAGLDRLAGAQDLSRPERIAAVSRLVPSEATHAQVGRVLRGEGFRVTDETSWSISADGAAARAASLFGARQSLGQHPDASRYAAATGALPRLPAPLADVVAAVYPSVDGPATFHHSSTSSLNGQDFRNADTPAGVPPSTGQRDAGATVATLQLADFYGADRDTGKSARAADLTSYAVEHGLPDPVAAGRYRAIKVDGGARARDDQNGGDIEVNLDQQSILSTAPTANQHAYFAPNTTAGFDDVFAHVYDDAVGNSHATAADRHIVAMSTSWGECESQTSRSEIATLEPILKSLLAAGVTVFASSGDEGIYDCGFGPQDHQADVDYPASSPSVVGVGGTRLSAASSTPNTGANWIERAWSCADPTACQSIVVGTGGGGGGASGAAASRGDFGGFNAPAYQRVGIDDPPFKGALKRLVPDIAADADGVTGFLVYTSNPDEMPAPDIHDVQFGGTSLAAPISAAQLTNALADAGRTTGVGDIHGALYSAYAQTRFLPVTSPGRPFRDITAGTNGAAAHRGSDPKTTAQAGYDTVSGLGAVLWSALVPYLLDPHKPSSSVSMRQPRLRTLHWRRTVAVWHVARSGDLRLLGGTTVRITRLGSSAAIYGATTLPASSRHSFDAAPGATYQATVVGHDLGGRRSAAASAMIQVPIDDTWFGVSPGWRRVGGSSDIGGSHLHSTTKSASASIRAYGRSYRLVVRTGPTLGRLGVYVHGRRIAMINLRTRGIGRERVTIYSGRTRARPTFTFKALTARPVDIDGLFVTY